ncbi:uncharacterized protein [Odocoileus virginianus]|uniref:Uncharacterized protein isoform X3 n=1 Tax=Odocoileus virginianus TaxID=9874 RepID=A0ABM4HVT7_ODOVR
MQPQTRRGLWESTEAATKLSRKTIHLLTLSPAAQSDQAVLGGPRLCCAIPALCRFLGYKHFWEADFPLSSCFRPEAEVLFAVLWVYPEGLRSRRGAQLPVDGCLIVLSLPPS